MSFNFITKKTLFFTCLIISFFTILKEYKEKIIYTTLIKRFWSKSSHSVSHSCKILYNYKNKNFCLLFP